jgi:DnaJ-domain-containing protein 1
VVYGRPVLRAFGIWQTIKRFSQSRADKESSSSNINNSSVMDKAQARLVLEVDDEASDEQVISAHKRLMAKNHPDKGGSTYIASQINQAKDVLLKD